MVELSVIFSLFEVKIMFKSHRRKSNQSPMEKKK